MTVADLQEKLSLQSAYKNMVISKPISGCHIGDLLSSVLKNAKPKSIWLTVINNENTIAVAMLRGLSAIIMCESAKPTAEAVQAAQERNIPILLSSKTAYELSLEIGRVI